MRRSRRPRTGGARLHDAEPLETRRVLAPVVAVGNEVGAASTPLIRLVDASSGTVVAQTLAFEAAFRGGVRVAMGDVTGDGKADVIAASGPGRVGEIRVFEQKQSGGTTVLEENLAYRTIPFSDAYRSGVEIAVGDVDGNGRDDLVAAMSMGTGTVSVFRSRAAADPIPNQPFRTFTPFTFRSIGGMSVAVADVGTFANGKLVSATIPDNKVEIVVGSGAGRKPTVVTYDLSGSQPVAVKTIAATFAPASGGVSVSTGRFNDDLIEDIVVSSGRGGNSITAVYDGTIGGSAAVPLVAFAAFAGRARPNAAAFTAPIDTDGNGRIDSFLATQGDTGAATGFARVSATGVRTRTVSTVASGVRIAAPRTVFKTVTDANGLSYFDVFTGSGTTAQVGKTISTSYRGIFATDVSGRASVYDPIAKKFVEGTFVSRKAGEQFDASSSASFTLQSPGLIEGWVKGIPGMKTGGRRVLVIPAPLGYGTTGSGSMQTINGVRTAVTSIPPNAPLIFDVGLISVS